MTIPDQEDLDAIVKSAGTDPDKLADVEAYVSELSGCDEAIDEGAGP